MHSVDPTRIDIATDPTAKRMRGVARHGNTPFDVPFISEIADNLWQGGCENRLVLPTFIKHVISLYPWEKYTINHDATYEEHGWFDSETESADNLDEIASRVNEHRADAPTLIHCQAGLNRSSLVVARALFLGGDFETGAEILAHLRATRSPAVLCNQAFADRVLSW